MLKIKDNVDLKELEKYGLVFKTISDKGKFQYIQNDDCWYQSGLMIDVDTRFILLHSGDYDYKKSVWTGKNTTTLYDLIKDGLVEKVSDK